SGRLSSFKPYSETSTIRADTDKVSITGATLSLNEFVAFIKTKSESVQNVFPVCSAENEGFQVGVQMIDQQLEVLNPLFFRNLSTCPVVRIEVNILYPSDIGAAVDIDSLTQTAAK